MTIPWKAPAEWAKQTAVLDKDGGLIGARVGAICCLQEAVAEAVLHLKPMPDLVTVTLADGSQCWTGREILELYNQLPRP